MTRLLAVLYGGVLMASVRAASHDDSFTKEGLFKAEVNQLPDTELVAHPDVPLPAGKNVLWCGTLQLAWNEAIGLVGEKLVFDREVDEVERLNRMDFTKRDLDAKSYVAVADFERNEVEAKIRAALEATFGGEASPELIPPTPSHPGPDDFVAYAYLYKNLAFAVPFSDLGPLNFGGVPVKSFGFQSGTDLSDEALEQVAIYDYRSRDDFIVELKTKSAGDELILAKVVPGVSLQGTVESVLERMKAHAPETAGAGDRMAVPKLNFDLRRDFRELEGLVLEPGPGAKIKNKLVLAKVEQLVRFQLNEKGAVLKSEAVVVMRALAMRPQHELIFDRPFLIVLKERGSAEPYFALWVGNGRLLVGGGK